MSAHSIYKPQSPVMQWLERRLPIAGLVYSSFIVYPTPRNLNYWWTFGGILAFMLAAIGRADGLGAGNPATLAKPAERCSRASDAHGTHAKVYDIAPRRLRCGDCGHPSHPLPSCRSLHPRRGPPPKRSISRRRPVSSDLGEIRGDAIRRRFIGTLTGRAQVCDHTLRRKPAPTRTGTRPGSVSPWREA